jgi:twitching motility two-component system response regulator PilG
MKSNKTFAVTPIGVPAHELQVIQRIFALCSGRNRAYSLLSPSAGRMPDIFLVDAENRIALTQWNMTKARLGERSRAAVMISAETNDSQSYAVRRPLLAPRVIATLDRVVISELGFAPEIKIGEVAEQSDGLPENLKRSATDDSRQPAAFKALVVDDSLPVRKQIGLGLKQFHAQIDYAESGERAMQFIKSARYDIIFLDVVLPGVDGYQICKLIKRDQDTKKTPVIMLTGKSSPFDRVKGTLAGCDSYLTKPVEYATFRKVVKRYVA